MLWVIQVKDRPITPQLVTDISTPEEFRWDGANGTHQLISVFGRWYKERDLTIVQAETPSEAYEDLDIR